MRNDGHSDGDAHRRHDSADTAAATRTTPLLPEYSKGRTKPVPAMATGATRTSTTGPQRATQQASGGAQPHKPQCHTESCANQESKPGSQTEFTRVNCNIHID
ncbi:hypothetical protein BD410DRAFT_791870, partial [Rickenella mellea]